MKTKKKKVRQIPLFRAHEDLVVDLFAGGGGASIGLEAALGRPVDIAINHDSTALAVHCANHPQTKHLVSDIWHVKPREVTGGRPVGLLWASPDCRDFSVAKGGQPRNKRVRLLAWKVVRWLKDVGPRVLVMENVREFLGWGPLDRHGKRIESRVGETFRRFKRAIEQLGYHVEHRILDASLFGAPTRRKRFFLVARRDGQPIVWPEPTHGPGRKKLHTAAECIDWSLPCRSIFGRKKPLADKTMWRIAQGIRRFVLESAHPFIVDMAHGQVGRNGSKRRGHGAHSGDAPLPTVTSSSGGGGFGVGDPFLVKVNHGKREARGEPIGAPMSTVTATQRGHALVTPFIAEPGQRHGRGQKEGDEPLSTIVAKDRHAVVVPHLTKFQQNSVGQDARVPLDTVMAGAQRFGVVAPTLIQTGYGERKGQRPRSLDLHEPLGTVVAEGQKHALVAAFIAKHFGDPQRTDGGGGVVLGTPLTDPIGTVTTRDHHSLSAVCLAKFNGNEVNGHPGCASIEEPLPTITSGGGRGGGHVAEVRAFLTAYYSTGTSHGQELDEPTRTVTAKHHLGLVTVHGVDYQIVDIRLRMLEPHELLRAQFGRFAASYDLSRAKTKAAKVRLIGNSVCPELAQAIVAANFRGDAARAA